LASTGRETEEILDASSSCCKSAAGSLACPDEKVGKGCLSGGIFAIYRQINLKNFFYNRILVFS
jgi:hypothetical protein